ncbi:MAG: deoxyribonuclease IV [Thermotaleaceae bacterium]
MIKIGCHLSVSKGFKNMGEEALTIGANTFQFFTRNPRGGRAKTIDESDVFALLELMKVNNFATVLAHAPYTLNACSADERVREFALEVMEDDLKRMEYLPNSFYNFHPGSHVGQGVEIGIEYIVKMLNALLNIEQTTIVLLETMAGKGTEIGGRFEELKQILDGVILSKKMGVCLDTCHVYDGGYDIVNDLDGVLGQFDKIIGLDKLYAIHLNDSKNPYNSRKDRHEKIGEGSIGLEAITRIINHPKLRNLPFFLETPNELPGYAQEIKLLKNLYKEYKPENKYTEE